MPAKLLMGIDIGTYGSKGVLCTPGAEIIAQHQLEHGLSVPRAGWAEHNADEVWWRDLCTLSRKLLESAEVSGEDVAALGASGLGPDIVPLDGDGRALRPAILYGIDGRAAVEIQELNDRFGPDTMAETGGMYLTSQAVGPKILWIRKHEPDIYKHTRYLCTSSTFLVYRLTGEYVLDYHTASLFSPLFDNTNLAWNRGYADAVVGDVSLPRLAWPVDIAGTITPQAAIDTGLKVGTPVTAGTIDAISEAVSSGVSEPGDLMMMFGTTAFMVMIVEELGSPDPAIWQTPYAFPGQRNVEVGMATTGALTRWFRDNFAKMELAAERTGGENTYAVLMKEAKTISAGSNGLVILPYFSGERTPLNDPMARGLVIGLSLDHQRAHIYRAILESIGYGLAHNLETMRALGFEPSRCVAVGGGVQNPLLLQIVSDITGMEQELPSRTIGAAYGDAYLAGRAVGLVTQSDLHSHWVEIIGRIVPDKDQLALYQSYYRIYRNLYPKTREEMHALAQLQSMVAEK